MSEDNYPGGPDENSEEVYGEDANGVEIYTKWAIWGFSIIFSTIFGGVLLMQNLKAAGYKKAAYIVLSFSIAYTLLAFGIAAPLISSIKYIGLILNTIGSAVLTEYFFNKYFPGDDYRPKPIWRALSISILILFALAIVLSLMILYVPGLKEQLEATK